MRILGAIAWQQGSIVRLVMLRACTELAEVLSKYVRWPSYSGLSFETSSFAGLLRMTGDL